MTPRRREHQVEFARRRGRSRVSAVGGSTAGRAFGTPAIVWIASSSWCPVVPPHSHDRCSALPSYDRKQPAWPFCRPLRLLRSRAGERLTPAHGCDERLIVAMAQQRKDHCKRTRRICDRLLRSAVGVRAAPRRKDEQETEEHGALEPAGTLVATVWTHRVRYDTCHQQLSLGGILGIFQVGSYRDDTRFWRVHGTR